MCCRPGKIILKQDDGTKVKPERMKKGKREKEREKKGLEVFGYSFVQEGGALKSPLENSGEFCLLVLRYIPPADFMGMEGKRGCVFQRDTVCVASRLIVTQSFKSLLKHTAEDTHTHTQEKGVIDRKRAGGKKRGNEIEEEDLG